jgi:hypothetical protein
MRIHAILGGALAVPVITAFATDAARGEPWGYMFRSPQVSPYYYYYYPRVHRSSERRSSHRKAKFSESEDSKQKPLDKVQGPLQIIVSINNQRVTLYDKGAPVARSVVSTGVRGHPTPMGVFSVIQKDRWHRSNIYSNAPMYYMQRITWSGVAMHAGVVTGRPASHGCIRLTGDFARRLWRITKLGVRVIVARNDVAPVEISHPHLFVPKPKPPEVALSPEQPAENANQVKMLAPTVADPRIVGVIKTAAAATLRASDAVQIAGTAGASDAAKPVDPVVAPNPTPRKSGTVSVFISRKERKLFVRHGFEPLFNAPVTIESPESALGTHVFTALELKDDGAAMRWNVVSLSSEPAGNAARERTGGKKSSSAEQKRQQVEAVQRTVAASAQSAAAALDRILIPAEAAERISELLSPGSSLIISDRGISGETGKGTDFVVLTR